MNYKHIDSLITKDLIGKYKVKLRGIEIGEIRFEIDDFFVIHEIGVNMVYKGQYFFKSFDFKNGWNLLFGKFGNGNLYHYEGSYFSIEFSQNFDIEFLKGKDIDFELITGK